MFLTSVFSSVQTNLLKLQKNKTKELSVCFQMLFCQCIENIEIKSMVASLLEWFWLVFLCFEKV